MNILYATTYDASNIHNWSGLGYYISKCLEGEGHELSYLKLNANFFFRLRTYLSRRFLSKHYEHNRSPYIIRQYSKQISGFIKPGTDVIFSPSSFSIAELETKIPKVFYTDATYAGLLNFYQNSSKIDEQTAKWGNYLEQKALDIADLAIYSSDWAAQTAIDNYKVSPSKIKVVPFGANIQSDRKLDDIKLIVENRSSQECHLLFLGVDWVRKGGEIALKVAEMLNENGIKTFLHIAGVSSISTRILPSYVINHGFISKATEEGRLKLNDLMSKSHFLILPTMADCTPVVYSEASSFGTPIITTDVGGIPTIVKDDINGMKFSPNSDIASYVNYITKVLLDYRRYKEMCYSSFNEYETRLNWRVAGSSLTSLMNGLR